MTAVYSGTLDAIGKTPLIKLEKASELSGCTIYGKAEFMNPGGSVKDRAALSIIRAAELSGDLRPGGTIVEGTAGNTGIGLTVVAKALGYRTVIVIPETQTQEKKDTLRFFGAELVEVPAAPYSNPNNFQHVARRLAQQLNGVRPGGAIFADQFDNVANRQAHIDTTAPEIYQQLDGRVDGFICAAGTGGTIAGVSMALKDLDPAIQIGLADPMGANLYNWYTHGELCGEGSSISEGIGQSRITTNLDGADIDHAFQITDAEALPIMYDLMAEEGLCTGSSTGINVAGAMALAQELGPGKTIVTILCDSGLRYMSRLFNPEFLDSKGLPVPDWLRRGAAAKTDIIPPFE